MMFRMCGCGPLVKLRIESLGVGPDEPTANVDASTNTANPDPCVSGRESQKIAVSPALTFRSAYSALSGRTTTDIDVTPLYHQFTVQPEPQETLTPREIDQLISFLYAYMEHRMVPQQCAIPTYVDVLEDRNALISLARLNVERMHAFAESFIQRDSFLAFLALFFRESPLRHLTTRSNVKFIQNNRYGVIFTQHTLMRVLVNYVSSHWSDTMGVQLFYAVRADLLRNGALGVTISDLRMQQKGNQDPVDQGSTPTRGAACCSRWSQNRMVVLSMLKCGTLLRIVGAIEPDNNYQVDCFELGCFLEVLLSMLDLVK
ncbi:hypothetical protein GL50803_0016126 [Giardia duodenalis]|uniref:Uncharacterized protein n=1 Tax=Giardia intestinalis (strain ATCC 50803 / WB clone C6) TaxID=184922 RepID=D3KGU9_GIAIC|nr:hypothetical protein GL50803_0016126 [Giardia intestinalis]KAE8305298.1 hypothetical protein GL50803_0016126 [Giardia intestinalis]